MGGLEVGARLGSSLQTCFYLDQEVPPPTTTGSGEDWGGWFSLGPRTDKWGCGVVVVGGSDDELQVYSAAFNTEL